MKTHSLYSALILTVIAFSMHSVPDARGQSAPPAETPLTLITSVLRDGTKIWGTLQMETADEYVVYDFNLGEIRFAKKDLSSEVRESAETSVIVETVNNGSYFGYITGATPTSLRMRSELINTFEIQSNSITRINLSGLYVSKRGENWFANPNATRYFFAPSAIPLKKKEGYFQNAYLLANSINIGVTDNISVGGGVVIPFLFYITPKVSYQLSKNIYAGAGILVTQAFVSDLNLSAGIGYGIVTVGNREHNASLGAGFGFSRVDSSYKATKTPIVTIDAMTRIGKRLSLVSENWIIPRTSYNPEETAYDPNGMAYTEMIPVNKNYYTFAGSVGMRFMPGIKTSVDFSVVGFKPNPYQNYLILPYLDFVYKFN